MSSITRSSSSALFLFALALPSFGQRIGGDWADHDTLRGTASFFGFGHAVAGVGDGNAEGLFAPAEEWISSHPHAAREPRAE